MAGMVNVTDSAAMPSFAGGGLGPISFNDIFTGASFNVGEGNSSSSEKTNKTDQTNQGDGSALYPGTPQTQSSGLNLSPEMLALAAAAGLGLLLIVVLASRQSRS